MADVQTVAGQLRQELKQIYAEFKALMSNPKHLIKEANVVVHKAVEDALAEKGYDTRTRFAMAIISRCRAKISGSGDGLEVEFTNKFEDQDMTIEWETADGVGGSSEFSTGELAEIFDEGRAPITIKPRAGKYLAIPPAGEEYNPSNKDNTIVQKVRIPAMKAAHYTERAKAALDEWVGLKQQEIENEFMDKFMSAAERSFK